MELQTFLQEKTNASSTLISRLLRIGLVSVESLAICDSKRIAEDLRLKEKTILPLIQTARKELGLYPKNAYDLLIEETNRIKLTTRSRQLDEMLDGGFWAGEITELVGGFSSGKTQLCHQLCVNVQLSEEEGGVSGGAYYIDTEGTFSARRLAQIAIGANLDPKEGLKNVFSGRAFSSTHLEDLLKEFPKLAEEKAIRLLVVDSLASHFRSEFHGKNHMIERQQRIMGIAERLASLASAYNIIVVVTNQIVANVDEFLYGESTSPALGYAWAHRPQTRIWLKKGRGITRTARLFDSARMPEREAIFTITADGIKDAM